MNTTYNTYWFKLLRQQQHLEVEVWVMRSIEVTLSWNSDQVDNKESLALYKQYATMYLQN